MIDARPLKGRRVVLTRETDGSNRLRDRLLDLGAEVRELPLIEVRFDLDREAAMDVFKEFASYEWLLFTSRNGVKHFFNAFFKTFDDIRSLGFIRIAVVGQGTAEALRLLHLRPDLVASEATAKGLAASLKEEQDLDNVKLLVITGNRNKEDLVRSLWEERAIVDTLRVYKTELCGLKDDVNAERFRREGADAVIFASASAVQAFGEQANHLTLEEGATRPALFSFGPSTSSRMKAAGIPVAAEAEEPGIDGIVQALVTYFTLH